MMIYTLSFQCLHPIYLNNIVTISRKSLYQSQNLKILNLYISDTIIIQFGSSSVLTENGSKGEDSHFEEGVLFLHGHPKPSPGAVT